MSETTIQVPVEHLEAIHQSLIGRHEDSGQRAEVEKLLDQVAVTAPAAATTRELTGSRVVLWGAIYESLCTAAERLAEECNEYWRGVVDPAAVRATIESVSTRFELLAELGAPPVD